MQPLATYQLSDFLAALGAKTPAPGGGAVAATTGASASALARMVIAYSIGKKALAPHEPALRDADDRLTRAIALFLQLADEDAASYALLNELQRLPEQDPRRLEQLPEASRAAMGAPLAAAAAAADLLRLLSTLVPLTNRHLRSDLAIAGILAEAALRSAAWNVSANLALITDQAERDRAAGNIQALVSEAHTRCHAIEAACRSA